MNSTIDNLIDSMSIEELLIIAGENQQTSTINISDSTINIYGMRGEHCTPSQPEPPIEEEYICANTLYSTGEFCEEYCPDCEERGATYKRASLSLLDFPLLAIPIVAPFYLVGKLFSTLVGIKKPISSFNQPSISPNISTNVEEEIIDTEIIEDKMSDEEIQEQLEYIRVAQENRDINEYTRLFRAERGIA